MNSSANNDSTKQGIARLAGKYLTFALAAEKYGVEILKVQEIIGVMHITTVPRSQHFLKGVINLRGKIIPVIDLRLKFGIEPIPYDERTCIIIVHIEAGQRSIPVGIVVDTVLEVTNFQANHIEPAPNYGANLDTSFVLGMGRMNDLVVVLIDLGKALADAGNLAKLAQGVAAPEAPVAGH